jgi:hypothetical protein
MPPAPRRIPLSVSILLAALILPSLSCSAVANLLASPTPAATATPEATATPAATATPESLLTRDERSQYLVILRYIGSDVRQNFFAVQDYLKTSGYNVQIDEGPSNVGDMDIILFGSLQCNAAIDDLESILTGKLDLSHLTRMRFQPADTGYLKPNIVVQIRSASLFGPGL